MNLERLISCYRPAAPVSIRPVVTLVCWNVLRAGDSEDFLVGSREDAVTSRQSSPIVVFSPAERVAVTASGRRYVLKGPPLTSDDHGGPFKPRAITGVKADDVTNLYWQAMLAAGDPVKVLFLDIDGVLHSQRLESTGRISSSGKPVVRYVPPARTFEWLPHLVDCLEGSDVRIVVHSTWGKRRSLEELRTLLGPLGSRLLGVTQGEARWASIQAWIASHPEVVDYRVLDDSPAEFPPEAATALIACDPTSGISDPSVRRILSAWSSSTSRAKPACDRDMPPVVVLQGGGIGPLLSPEEAQRRLDAMTSDEKSVDWIKSETLGTAELVAMLGITRGELASWRKTKRVVVFRSGPRRVVYPLRQFKDKKPVKGLDQVASFFSAPKLTWQFLVAPNRMLEMGTPIDALHRGETALVVSVAEAEAKGAYF